MKTLSTIVRQLQDKPGKNIPRREFIKNSVVSLAALTIVPRHVLGGNGFVAPSDKINIGLVGAGGRSIGIISDLFTLDDVQITTVADPSEFCNDDFFYKRDIGRGPVIKLIEDHYSGKTINYKVSEYEDFRIMLEKEKSLDAIVCEGNHNLISLSIKMTYGGFLLGQIVRFPAVASRMGFMVVHHQVLQVLG